MNIAMKVDAADAAAEAYATPLAELNPAKVERFQDDTLWPVFERLRAEDPVHFTPESEFGPYWSVTTWDHIMAVDTDHEGFSSAEASRCRISTPSPSRRRSGARRTPARSSPSAAAAPASSPWTSPSTRRRARR